MRLLGMSARILTGSQRRSGWSGQEDCGVVGEPGRENASRDRGPQVVVSRSRRPGRPGPREARSLVLGNRAATIQCQCVWLILSSISCR